MKSSGLGTKEQNEQVTRGGEDGITFPIVVSPLAGVSLVLSSLQHKD